MYLLMATSQNVDRIIRDFSGGNQQYAGAHLFFLDGMLLLLLGFPGGVLSVCAHWRDLTLLQRIA